ncbi:MAG: hypothetical protein ACRDUA_04980, partial [Micromonosporaceae bacterium]
GCLWATSWRWTLGGSNVITRVGGIALWTAAPVPGVVAAGAMAGTDGGTSYRSLCTVAAGAADLSGVCGRADGRGRIWSVG